MAAQANAIDRTRRMLSLVTYLRERPGAHVADVARAFGVSEAELISDLDVLPLCGTSFRGGDLLDIDTDGDRIWWHNPDDVAAPLRLAADEATALLVAARAVSTLPGLREGDRQALLRVTAKLEAAAGEAAASSSRLSVTFEAEGGVFADVDRAISERRRLWLRYYSPARDELTEREVDPIRLFTVGHTYMEAWCRLSEDRRTFRLDRVAEIRVLDEASAPPEIEVRDLSAGLVQPSADDPEVVIEVGPGGRWVAEYYPHDSAEELPDGGLRITLRSGDSWEMTRLEDGSFAVDGEEGYRIEPQTLSSLLDAVSTVTYEDILTEDASAYEEHMADFGLETPRIVAEIAYRDSTAITLRIGDSYALEETGWCYMRMDGDSRLFALDTGTADSLAVSKASLHPVEQPVLHKARFDRIVFTDEHGDQTRWELQGDIGTDAEDRWMLVSPMAYPADGEQMSNLRTNLANLRLGAYVGEATVDNLSECGFDTPRFRMEIHMAAGSIGTTDDDGVYSVTDWPEETFTLTVGGAKNDSVDYVLVGEEIYVTSHYSLATFMDMDPVSTLTRYTVPVALGNLAEMTVTTAGFTRR